MTRLRGTLCSAIGIIATVQAAAAQSTADGVAAFVQGDYRRAVEILKPAAENWPLDVEDLAATFLMAALYDNGLGIAHDPVRACTLYLRAGAGGTARAGSMWWEPATALAHDVLSRLGPEQQAWCYFLTNLGFDHGFSETTGALSSGGWISVELAPGSQGLSALIRRGLQETRVKLDGPLGNGGVRFLPSRLTAVTTSRPAPAQRDFLEIFTWIPIDRHVWSLRWNVFEIVGDTAVTVAHEEVTTARGDRPPHVDAFDPRDRARIRVNSEGDAEWTVLDDSGPRSDVIESDLERQEIAALKNARTAAAAKVDWKLTRDPERAPALSYADADSAGCWSGLYAWAADRTEAIMLRFGRDGLPHGIPKLTMSVGADVELTVHVFGSPQERWQFCSDIIVREPDNTPARWRASAGTVTIELSPVLRVRDPDTFRAVIRISDAEFISETGTRVRSSQPITLSTLLTLGGR